MRSEAMEGQKIKRRERDDDSKKLASQERRKTVHAKLWKK